MAKFNKLRVLLIIAVGITLCSGDEVHEHLKRLNKPHLHSFQSIDGDIIDCVHISQQLAFDDPSLKDHNIQMEPSNIPEGLSNEEDVEQLWQLNGTCPKETIPVRRTKREDILRAGSIENFGKRQHKSIEPNEKVSAAARLEYAVAYVRGGKYYGAKAAINVWKPAVMQRKEFSLSQLMLGAGPWDSNLNTIQAGWQEYPNLYGDYRTRFFIYWTRDNYRNTGCYNLACSGFIQTNNRVLLGGPFSRVSKYNGVQIVITILVWKDRRSGNWWLKVGNTVVGYWPSRIFTRLKNYANTVQWGGEIVNYKTNRKHTTTDMGSGYFPNQGFRKASYFRNVQTVDSSNTLRTPQLKTFARPSTKCYSIKVGTRPVAGWGRYFYYGGPGRNSRCP